MEHNTTKTEPGQRQPKRVNLSLPDLKYTFTSKLQSRRAPEKSEINYSMFHSQLSTSSSQIWNNQFNINNNKLNFATEINQEDNNLKLTTEETQQYSKWFDCKQTEVDNIDWERNRGKIIDYQQNEFYRTKYSDEGAFNEFYLKLHNYTKISRKGATGLSTPSFNFAKYAQKFKIVPNPVGIVKRTGESSKVELANHRLGDDYITCLCNSLIISDHITELNLQKNRLTDVSLLPLMKTMMENESLLKRIVNLNLSYNMIGIQGTETLAKYISSPNCGLEFLNLEANNWGDEKCLQIINSILLSIVSKIRYLNWGWNNLEDNITSKLAELIKLSEYLTVLILYQNRFRNSGAGILMSELKKHNRIKIIDLSWNLIGDNLNECLPSPEEIQLAEEKRMAAEKAKDKNSGNKKNEKSNNKKETPSDGKRKLPPIKKVVSFFAKELCELFKNKDTEWLHWDISYNSINFVDSQAISEDVKNNHTILGIHVDGNDMEIDELGFISPIDKTKYKPNHFAKSHIFYRIGNDHHLIKCNIINGEKIRGKNNCWICEGWKEIKFSYKPHNHTGDINSADVKLHLNFEDYKPVDMILRNDNFIAHRMCPPGLLNFYFTMNGIPVENYGQMTHEWKDALVYKQPLDEEDSEEDAEDDLIDKEPKQFIITKVAQTNVAINSEVISNVGYLKMIKYCEPRPEKKVFLKKRPRTPWSFPISIWAFYGYLYEGDTDESINDAFDFDFKRGQYSNDKDVNAEQWTELRTILHSHYRKIYDCYKNLSAYLGWKVWQIGQNQITEFANSCQMLLDSKYWINDVWVKVTEVKSNALDKEARKKNPNIADNIIRHQFMMLLFKIAKDKYFRTKQLTTVTESVKYSFDNHYNSYLNQFDNNKWRIERYYNEEVDNVIKAFIPLIDALFYSQTSQKIIGRKDSYWMWLEEFTNWTSVLMDSEFPVKEIPIIFNLSMRWQKNEIDFDKHYNMTFPEFLEAFSRFVDKLSPIPPGENKSDWDMTMRMEQPLAVKLETIMPSLLAWIKNPNYKTVKEKFQFPSRDDESGLWKIDATNQFYAGKLPPPKPKGKRKTIQEDGGIWGNN